MEKLKATRTDNESGSIILVVDDDLTIRQYVKLVLEREGYTVMLAGSGPQALAYLRDQRPDLVLLDCIMPDMDGYETCRRLCRDYDIPVIFLTAKAASEEIAKGFNVGGVDYLTKPVDSLVLLARVRLHLALAHDRQQLLQQVTSLKELDAYRFGILQRLKEINQLQQELLAPGALETKLEKVSDRIIEIYDAALCRIWLVKEGDRCESDCIHADQKGFCGPDKTCLHLYINRGIYCESNRPLHHRVPLGCYLAGKLAVGAPKYITNDISHDPMICNIRWIEEFGLQSFAGYQLRDFGGRTLGVFALFCAHALNEEDVEQLDGLSNAIAQSIAAWQVEAKLRESEETHRILFESSQDAIFTYAPPDWRYLSANSAGLRLYGFENVKEIQACSPQMLSPEFQPDGRLSTEVVKEMGEIALREGNVHFEMMRKKRDGSLFTAAVLLTRYAINGNTFLQATVRDITREKQDELVLRTAHQEVTEILEAISSGLIKINRHNIVTGWNHVAEKMFGLTRDDAVQQFVMELDIPWDRDVMADAIMTTRNSKKVGTCNEVFFKRLDGSPGVFDVIINPINSDESGVSDLLLVVTDMTESRQLHDQLHQAQKLESVGQLAAGIAHEINTPTQFVSDNNRFVKTAMPKVYGLLMQLQGFYEGYCSGTITEEQMQSVKEAIQKSGINYLMEQIPMAIDDSLEGLDRVARIVRAMKDFVHPGQEKHVAVDLNKAIESTTVVSRNEWKYVADMKLDLDPSLPMVFCQVGDINQMLLNIIINAAHAIKDVMGKDSPQKGLITISTRKVNNDVEIRISDTGTGIPEHCQKKIFDPFFTTKAVGKGTGQGLSIARSIVVEKHHGSLTFETQAGKGTTFIVRLPLQEIEAEDELFISAHKA